MSQSISFTKMQGAGNDYVYIDCFAQTLTGDLAELARRVSDRHFGIGGDGMILIHPSEVADARMQMFNADGSEAEMCGNGIRCVAKYVYDHDIAKKETLTIETASGVLTLELEIEDGKARRVRVNMGEPILQAERIPTTLPGNPSVPSNPVVGVPMFVAGHTIEATCVSMGNPHCVIHVPEASDQVVNTLGPPIERDEHFPARVNVEFIEILSPSEVRQRTWERGSGETLACGTGACAVCVAGVLSGRTERKLLVHLLGGDLEIEWSEADNHVYMTGPAEEVFSGVWEG